MNAATDVRKALVRPLRTLPFCLWNSLITCLLGLLLCMNDITDVLCKRLLLNPDGVHCYVISFNSCHPAIEKLQKWTACKHLWLKFYGRIIFWTKLLYKIQYVRPKCINSCWMPHNKISSLPQQQWHAHQEKCLAHLRCQGKGGLF